MTLSKDTRGFLESLMEYYTEQAGSYRQIAEPFASEIENVDDAGFGVIIGCLYSGFLQSCQGQNTTPSLDDMKEFNALISSKAAVMRRAVAGNISTSTGEEKAAADGAEKDVAGEDTAGENAAGKTNA